MSILKCSICSKKYHRCPAKTSSSKYCSLTCQHKALTTKIVKKCLICNEKFLCKKNHINRAKYCSRRCQHKSLIGHQPPNKGKGKIIIKYCVVCSNPIIRLVCQEKVTQRLYCSRKCFFIGNTGKNNIWWKGGKTIDKKGYILIRMKNHPHANKSGYVREHILVAEKYLNRYLRKPEVVHHIDGNTQNNNPHNLYVFNSGGQHNSYHYQKNKPILKSNII